MRNKQGFVFNNTFLVVTVYEHVAIFLYSECQLSVENYNQYFQFRTCGLFLANECLLSRISKNYNQYFQLKLLNHFKLKTNINEKSARFLFS